jgi:FKBP-type peptidyl-prolyl cis-trans isomerase
MIKKIVLYSLGIFVLFSCNKKTHYQGYTKSNEGYYYKLLSIGDEHDDAMNDNSIVLCEASMKKMNDSVFWDTKHDAVNGLVIDLSEEAISGSCNDYFFNMALGDSVSFLLKPSVLFQQYFNSQVPQFCSNDTLLKLNVKLIKVMNTKQYNEFKNTASVKIEDTELQELKLIHEYVTKNYKSVKVDANGMYTLSKTSTNLEPVAYGKRILIKYKATYLDGRIIDREPQELEFVVGTPDQVIKGLNIVIASLKKGETTKIIVPSRLAFGELGTSNGSIAPYTPLIYEVEIIDIK